jgi:hypothetical protein
VANPYRCIRTEFSGVYLQAPRNPQHSYVIKNSIGDKKAYMDWNTIRSDDYSNYARRQSPIHLRATTIISLQRVVIDPPKLQGSVSATFGGLDVSGKLAQRYLGT